MKYESSHNTPVFCTVLLHFGKHLVHHLVWVVARVESKEGLVDGVHQAGGQRTGFWLVWLGLILITLVQHILREALFDCMVLIWAYSNWCIGNCIKKKAIFFSMALYEIIDWLNLIFDGRLGLFSAARCQGLVHGGEVFKWPYQWQLSIAWLRLNLAR